VADDLRLPLDPYSTDIRGGSTTYTPSLVQSVPPFFDPFESATAIVWVETRICDERAWNVGTPPGFRALPRYW
jgi:hypothetical protein